MTTTIILATVAFVVGFALGFRHPASYCHLSTEQRRGFGNRASSGLINGVVLAAIVGVIAYVAFGPV